MITPAQLLVSDIGKCRRIVNTLCSEYVDQLNALKQSNEINRTRRSPKTKYRLFSPPLAPWIQVSGGILQEACQDLFVISALIENIKQIFI